MKETPQKTKKYTALDVVQSAELLQILVKKIESDCFVMPSAQESKHTIIDHHKELHWQRTEDKDGLFCYITLTLDAKSKADDSKLWFIKATLVAVYSMSNPDLDDEALEQFSHTSAVFNTHPYFRELSDTIMRRMGLHPMVLPLLKSAPKQVKEKPRAEKSGK